MHNAPAPLGLTDSERNVWHRGFQSGYQLGRTEMLHTLQEWARHEEQARRGK